MSITPPNTQFNVERFVLAQQDWFDIALNEIKQGKKLSHWMWYIFPQHQALGRSAKSQYYGISAIEEAAAYLQHPILGQRLITICHALLAIESKTATEIFGHTDSMKLQSCATLFAQVPDSNPVFHQVIEKYFAGNLDTQTLALLVSD